MQESSQHRHLKDDETHLIVSVLPFPRVGQRLEARGLDEVLEEEPVDREGPAFHLDHRRVVEVIRKQRDVDCRGHEDHTQVRERAQL